MVVIPSLHRGGAERVVSLLTQEWSKSHEVLVTVFDESGQAYAYGGRLVSLAVPASSSCLRKMSNAFLRITRLGTLMRHEKPELIVSFMESANFPAIFSALLSGRLNCLAVSVHNDPVRFSLAHRLLMPILYCFPKRVVGVSRGITQALESMGVPNKRLSTIPNPAPAFYVAESASQSASLPSRYILGVGRLHPQKGFDRLLEAFAEIPDKDLQLIILGEGDERTFLENQAKTLGISSRVSMPGIVTDPSPWYQNAICFVLSSRHEGWPNVLMEAMSNGCPVVSFDCRYGPSEIIEPGISGILVSEGNIKDLRAAIVRVIEDKALQRTMTDEGLKRVVEFNVGRLANRWFLV